MAKMIGSGLLMLLMLLGGCATMPEPEPETNEFFEHWRELAAESPPIVTPRREMELVPEAEATPDDDTAREPPLSVAERAARLHAELPAEPTSIHLVDVPIGTALRSLARVAELNIIINPSVEGSVNIHVKKVPWNDVFMGIIESYGLIAAREGGLLRVMSVEDLRRQVERKGLHLEAEQVSQLATRVLPVRFSDPNEIAVSMEPMLSRNKEGEVRGSVTVDRHTRSLVVRDTPENLRRLALYLREVDTATPQVLIEAHIIETTQEVARELGVQWGEFWYGSQRLSTADGDYTYQGGAQLGQQFGLDLEEGTVNFATARLTSNILEMQLRALQKNGKINILSRPSIATLDNHEAVLESGTEVPYQSIEEGETSVEYKDAVLRLLVTPQVVSEHKVKLKIEAQKDEVDTSREVAGNPFIIKKLAQTNLIVENGSTVVIAGLSKERQTSNKRGVPLLQDIPGLGLMFKSQERAGDFEELLIFITPRILNEETDFGKASAPGRQPAGGGADGS
ncbi:MAG: type IV pilus secretin PilQ [Desulfurivibrio sp.]|nr:type IV pilus secretin PilQ [Desulfurivibrio sp.]